MLRITFSSLFVGLLVISMAQAEPHWSLRPRNTPKTPRFQNREDNAWVVVDFKTDLAIASRLDEYRVQISLYARGIGRAIDLPTRGILFWI